MENKIVCQFPRSFLEPKQSPFRPHKLEKGSTPTPQDRFRFDSGELWSLVRALAQDNKLTLPSFHSLFLALGLLNYSDWKTNTSTLSRFNQRYRELASLKRDRYQIRVRNDDKSVVEWLWSFSTVASQSQHYSTVDFCYELCTQLFDCNIPSQTAIASLQQMGRYFLEINRQSTTNIFATALEQQRKETRSMITPFIEHFPSVLRYIRDHALRYSDCIVYGTKVDRKPSTNLIEQMITIEEEPSIFDKLFTHSTQHHDKERMYLYQKELNAIKKCTFSPTKTSSKVRTSTPKANTQTKKERINATKSPHLRSSPEYLKENQYTPKPRHTTQLSKSPSRQQRQETQPPINVTEIKGVDQMLQRLKRGREIKENISNYWEDQSAKNAQLAQRSVSAFDLTAHKYGHPKPLLFVDVETGIGKHQRIGLYGNDDINQVASNFAKAHQLTKKQTSDLIQRLTSIIDQYL